MASTVAIVADSNLTVTETFGGANSNDNTLTFKPQNEQLVLNGSSSPAVSKHADFSPALTAGAATIDLTALPGKTVDETVNGTGLKVQAFKFQNPSTNANDIVFAFGASNPYLLLGSAWKITLKPGQSTGPFNLAGAGVTIDSTHKNIDISGTGSQAPNVQLVLG